MTKKSIYYCLALLFLFFFWSSIANAYKVNSYRTSEEGWGEKTTQFTTNSEAVYINVVTSTDFADEGVLISFKWYRPDGSLEDDIGTNLLARRVYRSGLLVGFWTYMVIKGKDREIGQWRVEHWARGYKGGVLDWYLMFTAYFTIASGLEPPYEHLTLLKPNGGEIIPSGSGYTIEWEAEEEVETFKLKYSMDNGATWEKIADNILGMIYPWEVPTPKKNKANCLIKAIGYDASGKKIGKDTSDGPFTIEVLTVTSPTEGDTLTSGETHTITWTTNETKAEVAKVKLLYTKNGGKTWKKTDTIEGYDPETYVWTVPDVPKTKSKCRVKAVLKDDNGKTVAKAISDGFFTIEP